VIGLRTLALRWGCVQQHAYKTSKVKINPPIPTPTSPERDKPGELLSEPEDWVGVGVWEVVNLREEVDVGVKRDAEL
jgi:hypothetical protein